MRISVRPIGRLAPVLIGALVLGAAGGAYAGHQAEKNIRKKSRWQVRVRLDDGRVRTLTYANPPAFHQGDRVRLVRGRLNYVG